MFAHRKEWVELVWWEVSHQQAVLDRIKVEFEQAFSDFIETEGGTILSSSAFAALGEKYDIKTQIDRQKTDKRKRESFISIIKKAISEFENNREKYQVLLSPDTLEEEEDDLQAFKAQTLRNECPIIHSTLYSEAEELMDYKKYFNQAAPKHLFEVVSNISRFGREYMEDYNEVDYELSDTVEDFEVSELDGEEYNVPRCIGAGIRSHFLYKLYPQAFPNRSRNALWALWFLSGKETFDCAMDSEFLMVDVENVTTQQNYFYPYDLFTYYAFQIHKLLVKKAESMDVFIDPEYRYVIVDAFLNYVANLNSETINMFPKQIANGGYGYA